MPPSWLERAALLSIGGALALAIDRARKRGLSADLGMAADAAETTDASKAAAPAASLRVVEMKRDDEIGRAFVIDGEPQCLLDERPTSEPRRLRLQSRHPRREKGAPRGGGAVRPRRPRRRQRRRRALPQRRAHRGLPVVRDLRRRHVSVRSGAAFLKDEELM